MLSKLESRKECMEQIELIQHWNYFCSLAERLDDTKHYIDHGLQEHDGIRELVHGKVYSDIFKQIIVLAASEFEIMSKALCSAKVVKTKRIGDISETILGVFPKIIDFEVSTPFWINTPLHDWKTTRIDNGKNVKVEGLDWWFAYNSIKHDEKESIKNATFENAVLALASLYIILRQIGNTMEKEDIEEVVSDVFFAIWKQADKINIDNSDSWNLKAYLASIAKKKAINKLRQKSKLNIIPFENNTYKKDSDVSDDYIERQVYENSAGIVQSRYDNPEDYVVNKERMEQVGEAIRALKSPDKDIFMQYHYDGMTINEISSNYGINENTIKSKLFRCGTW